MINCYHAEYFLCTTLSSNYYHVNLQYSSLYQVLSIRVENIVDTDQMASSEAI